MSDKLLFLTGHLAEERLKSTLAEAGQGQHKWTVHNVGIKVAALLTETIRRNRLEGPLEADQVILPGRVRIDLESLSAHYGVPFIL